MVSPFLTPNLHAQENQLALLHLRRDLALPTVLSASTSSAAATGYAEGVVTNTRFGSFPHSTLIDLPWGSQVRASEVDTGTRGRKPLSEHASKKRKLEDLDDAGDEATAFRPKEAVTASSGFIHVLPPTPENWTTSLPHRTQVVYTPDYSYILHRIRARPGSILIEAGSGSGSFTHAAARAVFSGYPESTTNSSSVASDLVPPTKKMRLGKVFSYEFHKERFEKVTAEMKEHGLESIVLTTHRDVYHEGFAVASGLDGSMVSPVASAVFLDLPAPWQALAHLTRQVTEDGPSPLDPVRPVHICTFSPCIEQAQKTVSALRQNGWIEIEMVEMQHKRIEVKREYTGLQYEGMRGVNAIATNVDQALSKLREVEQRAREFHSNTDDHADGQVNGKGATTSGNMQHAQKALFNQGTLVHRSEPELKTHTSYLVFAVLQCEWTDEDEEKARNRWKDNVPVQSNTPKSRRQLKREDRQKTQRSGRTNGQAVETSGSTAVGMVDSE